MSNKILIIIPAYNEEHIITQVIQELHTQNTNWDLLVINDGSTDGTKERAESTGIAEVIDLPFQVGIGSCVQTGFIYANEHNYDYALQFDGDGQHNVSEINKLLEGFESGNADVINGSRFRSKKTKYRSTISRSIGIIMFKILNSLLIKQKITDNTSGFRAYNKKAIAFLSKNYPADYPEPEAVILLGRNGFTIEEISVEMNQRSGGTSSIRGIYSVYYMVKVFLSILLTSIRPKLHNEQQSEEKV